jgi:cysteine-S-conjugate beta-lyase
MTRLRWSTPLLLDCGVAEMDFGTSQAITDALSASVARAEFGYTSTVLERAVKTATARYLATHAGAIVDPDRIELLDSVLDAVGMYVELTSAPGDTVVVFTPTYKHLFGIPAAMNRYVVELPMQVGNQPLWERALTLLRWYLIQGCRNVIACHPGNPTGHPIPHVMLRELIACVAEFGATVFVDEAHAPLMAPGHSPLISAVSASEYAPQVAWVARTATKGWNISGLKCAQVIVPETSRANVCRRLSQLARRSPIGRLGAIATCAAYTDAPDWPTQVMSQVTPLKKRVTALFETGGPVTAVAGQATYFLWLEENRPCRDHLRLFDKLLKRGVLTEDGSIFGRGFDHSVRVNVASSEQVIERLCLALTDVLHDKHEH